MCVLLESIEKEPESGRVRLMIRVGDESAKMFLAQLFGVIFGAKGQSITQRRRDAEGGWARMADVDGSDL